MEINLKRMVLYTSLKCNIKCKFCSVASPYYDDPEIYSLDKLKKTIDRFFEVVTYCERITVQGGEPLIYQEFAGLMEYILKYQDRFKEIYINTNGTMLLPAGTLDVMKTAKDKFFILVDDYGKEISKKVEQLDKLLTQNGINHEVRPYNEDEAYCGGWFDYGDWTKQRFYEKEEIEKVYSECMMKDWPTFSINDGKMHPCGNSRVFMEFGVIPFNDKEYYDLLDDKFDAEEIKKRILEYREMKSLTACAYCRSVNPKTAVRIIPAQQLTKEEIALVKEWKPRNYHELCEMKAKRAKEDR